MIVVTGGAGFIGSAVVWRLNQAGVEDILIADSLGRGDKWRNLAPLRFADYLPKDEFLEAFAAGRLPDARAVVHMGACSATTERDADYLMRNNYAYSRRLCACCLERSVRFVNASSAATYGDGSLGFDDAVDPDRLRPLNMYGYSKQLFDQWAGRQGALERIASLKFFNVYGPNEYHKGDMASVVLKSFRTLAEGDGVTLFRSHRPDYADGEQRRDFLYIKDCVDVIVWFMNHPEANGVFNVGSGRSRSWNDLARALFAALGRPERIDYVDMPPALREKYQYFTEARLTRLRAAGYVAPFRDLEEGVRDYAAYLVRGEAPLD